MTSIISLPQEIIDAILDELANLCRNASVRQNKDLDANLRNCNQVSRTFRSHARRLLFCSVSLGIRTEEKDSTSSRNFRNLLEGDPELAKLVHTFRLNLNGRHVMPRNNNHKVLDEHLPVILGLLPNLRKLFLASLDGLAGWKSFTNEVRTAIFRLHDLPSLKSLELYGYNLSVPVDFVARWTTLQDLHVHASPFDRDSKASKKNSIPKHIKNRHLPQLTSLHLLTNFGSTKVLLDIENGAILRGLTSLEAQIYGYNDWAILWKVMRSRCSLLEHLTIRNLYATTMHDRIVAEVDMDYLETPNLRSLVYEERSLQIETDDVGYIADLLSSQFASGPKLESICVTLEWTWPQTYKKGFFPTAKDTIVIGREDAWYKLDMKLAAFASFKRLDIHLHYIYDSQEMATRLKAQFANAFEWWIPENAFPILSSKNDSIIRLSLSDTVL